MPRLAGLLKKREKPVTGKWEVMRFASFTDFRHLFNDQWFGTISTDVIDYKSYREVDQTGEPGICPDCAALLENRLEAGGG